ncbi:Chemotaxis protein methyltransferase Cher2 [Planctomycetes bacterium CA13]|uniref:protein-glutamate O-methyltransferase n=1 Tax=Novipirellula herctigrandis TaxID=2527986 RepID=A0A5C5YX27_9BACT|nr:Chemotaxis protein methyltransferase Cher2 [Planctomycetes bacterium CA13]
MITADVYFSELCDNLRAWCGVTLSPSKTYLVQNRLRGLMSELDTTELGELLRLSKASGGGYIRDRIVDALTTHETLFFRDRQPFEALTKHIIPEIQTQAKGGRKRLRLWSAACSTGQEPYSIAMSLIESVANLSTWDISIVATDVSPNSVEKARTGIFQDHELRRGISDSQQRRFFKRVGDGWQINDEVKRLVRFEIGNLLSGRQPDGLFDIIFCRNVVIYFSGDDPLRTFEMLSNRLSENGRLFVGCSEVLTGMGHILDRDRIGSATCYKRLPIASTAQTSTAQTSRAQTSRAQTSRAQTSTL